MKIVIHKRDDLRRGKLVKIVFCGFFFFFYLVIVKLFQDAFAHFDSSSIPLTFMGVALSLVILFIAVLFTQTRRSLIHTIEMEPDEITFQGSGYTLRLGKDQMNAIIVEYQTLKEREQTTFKFLVRTYPNEKLRNRYMKDEHNLSFTNQDIPDSARGEKVKEILHFLKTYYNECLLVKGM